MIEIFVEKKKLMRRTLFCHVTTCLYYLRIEITWIAYIHKKNLVHKYGQKYYSLLLSKIVFVLTLYIT